MNRLSAASAGPLWGEAYSYDGFGNLTQKMPTQSPAPAMSATYDTNNHQIGLSYDASGNQLADPLQTVIYGWDGENRMVSQATLMSPSSTTAYTYDAWGKRVEVHSKPAGADETWEFDFYGVTGQKLVALTCDTDASAGTTSCWLGGIGYFGGKRLGVATDRLGSVRSSYGTSISYFPYGEERTVTADGTEKFGTYFRDGVGQDYAEQRYYNNGTGRFWSVDPGGIGSADPSTPTSLNRYAYTNGDPVNFFDRRGLIAQAPSAEDCIANPEYCEAWDWNSAYGCNPGMYLVAQPGCETGGGSGESEDSEAEPNCMVELMYRPVSVPGLGSFVHSYVRVQDRTGQVWILEGEPQNQNPLNWGHLVGFATKGNSGAPGYPPDNGLKDNEQGSPLVGSGNVCDEVDQLIQDTQGYVAALFHGKALNYSMTGPNSNTFAHLLLQALGLSFGTPPGSEGWIYPPPKTKRLR